MPQTCAGRRCLSWAASAPTAARVRWRRPQQTHTGCYCHPVEAMLPPCPFAARDGCAALQPAAEAGAVVVQLVVLVQVNPTAAAADKVGAELRAWAAFVRAERPAAVMEPTALCYHSSELLGNGLPADAAVKPVPGWDSDKVGHSDAVCELTLTMDPNSFFQVRVRCAVLCCGVSAGAAWRSARLRPGAHALLRVRVAAAVAGRPHAPAATGCWSDSKHHSVRGMCVAFGEEAQEPGQGGLHSAAVDWSCCRQRSPADQTAFALPPGHVRHRGGSQRTTPRTTPTFNCTRHVPLLPLFFTLHDLRLRHARTSRPRPDAASQAVLKPCHSSCLAASTPVPAPVAHRLPTAFPCLHASICSSAPAAPKRADTDARACPVPARGPAPPRALPVLHRRTLSTPTPASPQPPPHPPPHPPSEISSSVTAPAPGMIPPAVQVMTSSAAIVYHVIADMARPSAEGCLLDLYCGIGPIGLSLANRCKAVIGVDNMKQNITGGRSNAAALGAHNCTFIRGAAESVIRDVLVSPEFMHASDAVAVINPPRGGAACACAVLASPWSPTSACTRARSAGVNCRVCHDV